MIYMKRQEDMVAFFIALLSLCDLWQQIYITVDVCIKKKRQSFDDMSYYGTLFSWFSLVPAGCVLYFASRTMQLCDTEPDISELFPPEEPPAFKMLIFTGFDWLRSCQALRRGSPPSLTFASEICIRKCYVRLGLPPPPPSFFLYLLSMTFA